MTNKQREKAQEKFLKSFRVYGSIRRAAAAAGITRQAVYDWKKNDPEFLKAFEDAEEDSADRLEEEAFRRAYKGDDRLKFDKNGDAVTDPRTGEVYVEKVYSDSLIQFLLKARRPLKFREPKVALPGADGANGTADGDGGVQHEVIFHIVEDWRQVERKG